MFVKFNSVEFSGIIASNRLKKFHVYEVNLIENFAYLTSKVLNITNAKKSWHLINDENKSAKDDN